MEKSISRHCPRCDGTGKIIGKFPIYANDVPLEKRKHTFEIKCDICISGIVDEHFPIRLALGDKLRSMRFKHNLALREFAKRFELDIYTVSRMERGCKVSDEDTAKVLVAFIILEDK